MYLILSILPLILLIFLASQSPLHKCIKEILDARRRQYCIVTNLRTEGTLFFDVRIFDLLTFEFCPSNPFAAKSFQY
jgi:hypothetical protein